jgi:tetratricopeptide (TPR) repeat protein
MKSNEKSLAARNEGNAFYVQRKFHESLLKYNESLCLAEAGSENLGYAYANRSAVYFELRVFDKCLKNVEAAMENHYPEKSWEILKKRQEKCQQLSSQQEKLFNPWNFFKLSHPPNEKIPYIADCLQVKTSDKFGRYVVTNKALKVGDVIAIEKPFCSLLDANNPESNIFQRCSNCARDNAMDLYPCSSCCRGEFSQLSMNLNSISNRSSDVLLACLSR